MSVPIEEYCDDYRANGFVLIRDFVAEDEVARLWSSCCTAPVHRCHVGDKQVTWGEATLSAGHPGHDYFRQGHVRDLVEGLAPVEVAPEIHCWISLYQEREYIGPHRDRSGVLQMLVCLQSPRNPSSGGHLVLADSPIFLRSGDAVIFAATHVEHRTTPLRRTATDPAPVRAVLVGRCYAKSPIWSSHRPG